jgi:hypothetical protein
MISSSYRNILYGMALIGIIILIIMPDVVIGLLFELLHFLFELLFHIADISFEWLETLLDHAVEHLFHTDPRQTQIIVFYIMVGLALYPLYRLWLILSRLFFRLKEAALAAWTHYKNLAIDYWQELSFIERIKLAAIAAGVIYLASFLFM